MSGKAKINLPKEKIEEFCRRHHIRKLAVFGSVLRDDFRSASDVDILVEFDPSHTPGFIRLHDMERELSHLLGDRKIDLVTAKFLNPRIRERVLATAEVQYAEG